MPTTYEIHPAIGIARVGTSDEFFIGPEPGAAAAGPDRHALPQIAHEHEQQDEDQDKDGNAGHNGCGRDGDRGKPCHRAVRRQAEQHRRCHDARTEERDQPAHRPGHQRPLDTQPDADQPEDCGGREHDRVEDGWNSHAQAPRSAIAAVVVASLPSGRIDRLPSARGPSRQLLWSTGAGKRNSAPQRCLAAASNPKMPSSSDFLLTAPPLPCFAAPA